MGANDLWSLWENATAVQQWLVAMFAIAFCFLFQPLRWIGLWLAAIAAIAFAIH
jgi:hypothetical protein